MKTNFATAAIAATYLAISAHGQNFFRFLQDDTCEIEAAATYKNVDVQCVDDDGNSMNKNFYLKGLDERALCTDGDQVEIGLDNRAWVLEEYDSALKPNFLNGTLRYVVNVSDVGCNCAAGMFLVALDDDKCTMGEYESDSPPDCPTIDVMKANKAGFKTKKSCPGSSCEGEMSSSNQYGAGPGFVINTLESYSVQTEFFADDNNQLTSIKTTLSQYSGAVNNQVILELDEDNCDDFAQMGSKLNNNMAIAISMYGLDVNNNPLSDQCSEVCSSGRTIISGVQFTDGPDTEEDEDSDESDDEGDDDVLMWGDAAPSLTSGLCDTTSCTECRESWYDSDPNAKEYRCKDETVFKYGNKCNNKKLKKEGMNLCMTGDDQFCHWSYPADDKKKGKSEFAACRSVPQDYIQGDWKFGKKEQKNMNKGLCRYGCEEEEGTCHMSWPMGEKSKNNPKTMARCKPKQE